MFPWKIKRKVDATIIILAGPAACFALLCSLDTADHCQEHDQQSSIPFKDAPRRVRGPHARCQPRVGVASAGAGARQRGRLLHARRAGSGRREEGMMLHREKILRLQMR